MLQHWERNSREEPNLPSTLKFTSKVFLLYAPESGRDKLFRDLLRKPARFETPEVRK
jgi:hypothetical protein